MKKERLSNVLPQHKQTLENLAIKKSNFGQKVKSETKRTNKHGQQVKKTDECMILQPVKFQIIEQLPWLEDRLEENVLQWGIRTKIDVEKVKALAAKLQQPKKKPTTTIRMKPAESTKSSTSTKQ